MKIDFSVALYVLGHLVVPLFLVFIAHAVFLGIFNGKVWYKVFAYFAYCGIWCMYTWFLSKHNGLQSYFIFMALIGTIAIAAVLNFLNKRSSVDQ